MEPGTIDSWPADAIEIAGEGWADHVRALVKMRGNGGVSALALADELARLGRHADAAAVADLDLVSEPLSRAAVQQAWKSIRAARKAATPMFERPARAAPSLSFRPSDSGNAERFVSRHNREARYVHKWERWLVWDEIRWAPDDRREVYRKAIGTARSILAEASEAVDPQERADLAKLALQTEKRDRLEAMLYLARSLPPIGVLPNELDTDPDLLNVPNGVLDLRAGQLLTHSDSRLITKLAPVPYQPTAEAPNWTAFLERVFPDAALRAYLKRAVGYSLTGSVDEQCLFFCYGTGANGKSTFLETVRDLLGEGEYAKASVPELLLAQKSDRHQAEVADLQGARFVTTVELGDGRCWDESRVKWLTGGDVISARFLYGNPFSFRPTHKFWIAANHRPRVHGTDFGFWRRVHFVPFVVTIPKAEQDPDLRTKLRAELPGILRWAVDGCLDWRCDGLRPPDAVLEATKAYRSAEDVIGAFLDERCKTDPNGRVLVGPLYDEYRRWADQNGERQMTKRKFSDCVEERGFQRGRTESGRHFTGLSLDVSSKNGG